MATRGNQTADNAATTATGLNTTLENRASGLYAPLAPQLINQSINPQGFSPTDEAKMTTAAQEGAGGGAASAVGQGGLKAARTHNAGGSDAAIADAARTSGENASEAALKVAGANAQAKMHQQEHAQNELGNLEGQQQTSALTALGQVPGDVNASTNAEDASWNWTKGLKAISDALTQGGKLAMGGAGGG